MIKKPHWPRRKRLRRPNFDYASFGAYFVTICTHDRDCCLAEIRDSIAALTDAGCIVAECWQNISEHYPDALLDAFVVMPNHIHGLILLQGAEDDYVTTAAEQPLCEVIRWFKTNSSKRINRTCTLARPFHWQRSFHDRIVRDEHEYHGARQYICHNPQNWESDQEFKR